MATSEAPFDRVYRWKRPAPRKRFFGRRCRLLAKGTSMNSVLVEFEDGEKIVTSARAIRLMDARDEAHLAQAAFDV